ncbi:MAG: tRNA (guanosine(37)-N1)-methyltransferase TrmD [Clostridia bacterium]|nr:tRNA (guanosine(37)-N1)-methyltransferase TrmD [Clostridia bacterium]
MKIDILTLFPEMFDCIKASIIGRAIKANKVEINIIDVRQFSIEKHKKCDDYPYGGGFGMVLTPQPLYDAIMSVKIEKSLVVLMSPKGDVLNQGKVCELAKYEHLIIVCGHYEGIDERIINLCVDCEISIGDYILTGGEIPAMVILDAVCRYVPDVITDSSLLEESFSDGLLEYPQYTRPQEFKGLKVPEILITGNHQKINDWRLKQSIKITKERRKDLYKEFIKKSKTNQKNEKK